MRCSDQFFTIEYYVKGVASFGFPSIAAALPTIDSTNIPIVILDGKACGLIITSGQIPLSLNGKFTDGYN